MVRAFAHIERDKMANQSRRVEHNGSIAARILDEKTVYAGYISVLRRRVEFASPGALADGARANDAAAATTSEIVDFDIAGHPSTTFKCAVVLPYHSDTNEVTVVREYAHGPGRYTYALPSGNFDPKNHKDLHDTAVHELEEEAHLTKGTWHALLPRDHPGVPEVKWCANAFTPYLCVDPEAHGAPKSRDWVETVSGQRVERVDMDEFVAMLTEGRLLLPSIATGFMAIARLRQLGMGV